jgi:hypothetical protein
MGWGKLIWTIICSRLGIIGIAALALAGFGAYHTAVGWKHDAQVAKIEKAKDEAIRERDQERAKVISLEKTIKFQKSQLANRKRAQQEVTDVTKAVANNDLDFIRRNYDRLYFYKNPAAAPVAPAPLHKSGPKPPAKAGPLDRKGDPGDSYHSPRKNPALPGER